MFQVSPKYSRLMSVAALKPTRSSPIGAVSASSKSTWRVTGLVVSRTVGSPTTSHVAGRPRRAPVPPLRWPDDRPWSAAPSGPERPEG